MAEDESFGIATITTGVPTLGTPTLDQNLNITPADIAVEQPSVPSIAATHIHNFTVTPVTAGSPSIPSPEFTQLFGQNAITAGVPSLGAPALSNTNHFFNATAIRPIPTVDIDLGVLTQNHALVPTSNVFMAFEGGHPQVPLETYTNVSDSIPAEIWSEPTGADLTVPDPWTKNVA